MKAEYRRDLQHSYLVLCPEDKRGDAYPLRMVTENQIQGLLSCSCRRIDDATLYYYDITSRISLAERCLCRKITGDELLVLVQCLIRVLLDMEEYLLNGDSLYLEPEYIYMDVQMKKVDFCYVPGELWDLERNFRELMEGLLPFLDHRNQEGVMAGYGLYHYAVQESFSIEGLQRQLKQYCGCKDREVQEKLSEYEEELEVLLCDRKEKQCGDEGRRKCEVRNQAEEDEKRWKEQKIHEAALDAFFEDNQEERNSYPVAVTLGTIGVALYGLAGWYLWRNFPGYLWIWGAVGITGIAVGSVCIWKRKKKKECPEHEKDREYMKDIEPSIKMENLKKADAWEEIKDLENTEQSGKACYTQILQTEAEKGMYVLEEKYPSEGQQICLKNINIQFIGHLKEMADIILPSNAVSRLHARFRKDGEKWYLRDLNSRNGTWVNGKELQGEEEVEVKPGDEIRFADLIYHLRLL